MDSQADAAQKAAATYNAAFDFYDHSANAFWERYGQRTVARLGLAPGAQVLDVCSGSGASALPAADAVGPTGFVLGVDLAENLLALAHEKANNRQHDNVAFRVGNMLELSPGTTFDAVICVFGIFFVPDMQLAVRKLWSVVRPGGQLAITTWGPRFLEPLSTAFWDGVRRERPDLHRGYNPWDRISEPDALRDLLLSAGAERVEVAAESGCQPLRSPDDWWPMVLGTGYRGTIEQLDADARARIRQACLDLIRTANVRSVETNVVYGRARKSAGDTA